MEDLKQYRDQIVKDVLEQQPIVQHIERNNLMLTKWNRDLLLEHLAINQTYEENGKRYLYSVKPSKYRCVREQLTPDMAHLRNLNYACDLQVNLDLHVYELPDLLPEKKADDPDQKAWDAQKKVEVFKEQLADHVICAYPNMLHGIGCIMSDGCGMNTRIQHDMGGSFIQRGKRRFIPFMERLHFNDIFLMRIKSKLFAEVRSEHLDRPHRSTSTLKLILNTSKKAKMLGQRHQITAMLPYLTTPLPLHVLVLALGCSFDQFEQSVYQMDEDPETLKSLIEPCLHRMRHTHHGCKDQISALDHIVKIYKRPDANQAKVRGSIVTTLKSEVLPHLNFAYPGDDLRTNQLKVRYIAMMCGLLYRMNEGLLKATDRDSYQHKVLDGAADLLAQMFRQLITNFTKAAVKTIRRTLHTKPKKKRKAGQDGVEAPQPPLYERVKLDKLYGAFHLTPKLMSAVSTGRWSDKRKGVSHPMRTTNYALILAQLRRVSSSYLTNQGKHIDPRMAHPTSYAYVCTGETPDGEACGLVYTLAVTCMVTPESDGNILITMLLEFDLKDLFVPLDRIPMDNTRVPKSWWKFIGPHGVLHGWVTDPHEAARRVRRLRRSGCIDPFVSVYLVPDRQTLCIKCSPGRVSRPLIVLENVRKLTDILPKLKPLGLPMLHALLAEGIVEYLDAAESYSVYTDVCVALNPKNLEKFHTHMELTDYAFFGICAAALPMVRFNQGPRISFQCGMTKQYISPEAADDYGANTSHYLHYGQKPLVSTHEERVQNYCDGNVVVLALMPHERAQEDAIVIKAEALERGAFTTTSIRTHSATHTPRNPNQPQDRFERPAKGTNFLKLANYDKLKDDGLPAVGTYMAPGDIVIGRTIPQQQISQHSKAKIPDELKGANEGRRDASIVLRKDESGIVHEVIRAPLMRKVRIRTVRKSEQGDKFSNRHGQKGTLGIIERAVDMPFSQSGIIPDMICNPTSMPSRMTLGFPLEMLIGKAVALSAMMELGYNMDDWDAALTEETLKKLKNVLEKCGYKSSGTERLYDGKTGRMIEADIMMGPIFYGKMDHMVAKKVHARARGPVQPVIRQPVEGRRSEGGFRLGTMEIDVLVAYGAAWVLNERAVRMSDEIKMYCCGQCGFVGEANPQIGLYMCRFCRTAAHMRTLRQSMSTMVMFTELSANGISTRFHLKDLPRVPDFASMGV